MVISLPLEPIMTTFPSSSSPNEPVIPGEAAVPPPSATTAAATGTHHTERAPSYPPVPPAHPAEAEPRPPDPPYPGSPYDPVATVDLVDPVDGRAALLDPPDPAPGKPYGDPVGDLVHTAVSDRPLEDVADLITALERSPEHTRSVVDALRTAGIGRSVEDVTRLVALLTLPPRDAASADETIRAAAAHRSVEDVTRLVALLHSEPLAPHCREEALRAAATGRSVDELVELIDRLAAQRPVTVPARTGDEAPGPERARRPRRLLFAGRGDGRPRLPRRSPAPVVRSAVWPGWLAAVALAVCAVTHFPLRHDGVSLGLHAYTVGLSVLCTALALILVVRPGAVVLAGAFVVPALLAAAHAYGGSFPSAVLSRSLDLALAPAWLSAPAAFAAALLALAALVVRVASPLSDGRWTPSPAPKARRVTE